MPIVEKITDIHDMIIDNYDCIWQEDWYVFYDEAKELCAECLECGPEVQASAEKLSAMLDEGGDIPDQETWFDICSAVYALAVDLEFFDGILGRDFFFDKYASIYDQIES